MKKLFLIFTLAASAHAANPTFESFNTNEFATTSRRVAFKNPIDRLNVESLYATNLYVPQNITWFGAIPDDGVDDSAAIQAAINRAQTNGGSVLVPPGDFSLASGLNITNVITILGSYGGLTASKLTATADLNYMLRISTPAEQTSRSTVRDLMFDGNNFATNGIYSEYANHTVFARLRTTGTKGWGINIGFGWCNSIVDSEFSFSPGGGIRIHSDKDFGGNNALNIINNKIFLNSGIGIQLQSGYNMNLIGNTIESNAVTGIFLPFQAEAVNIIGGYIEQNGATGHTFTNVGVTVNSQIILNGVINTNDMGFAFPCVNVNIEGVFVSDDAQHCDSFIYAAGVENLTVFNNRIDEGGAEYVVKAPLNRAYANPRYVNISQNNGFLGNVTTHLAVPNSYIDMSTWRIEDAKWQNYATDNDYEWSIQYSAVGTISQNAPTFLGHKTVAVTGMDNDAVVGVVLDLDRHTNLWNKLIQVGAWVKADNTAPTILSAFISNRGQSIAYTNSLTDRWVWLENQAVANTNGTMVLGFKQQLNDGNDVLYFSNPIISEVGVRPDQFYPKTEELFLRKNGNYLQIGQWSSQANTTNGLALVAGDVSRWLIGPTGHMQANGINNITSDGALDMGVIRARNGTVFIYEDVNPGATAVYFLTEAAATKGYVGFPGSSSTMYFKNQLNGGTLFEDSGGHTFNSVIRLGATNVISGSGGNLVYTNGSTAVNFTVRRGAGDSIDMGVDTAGRGVISSSNNEIYTLSKFGIGTLDPRVPLDVTGAIAFEVSPVSLTGDDTTIGSGVTVTELSSDDAVSGNRTFLLNNSAVRGQIVTLYNIAGGAQLLDNSSVSGGTGVVKLQGDWNTGPDQALTLVSDGTNLIEIARSNPKVSYQVACSGLTNAVTAGAAKGYFRMPKAMRVTAVRASLFTAQASGSIFTVDINEGGASILSTLITVDNTEKTSTTAVTAPVISDVVLADDAEITFDVDQVGNGTATGLIVTLIGYND